MSELQHMSIDDVDLACEAADAWDEARAAAAKEAAAKAGRRPPLIVGRGL